MAKRPKAVCRDCKKRNPGCHSRCQDYISFRKELEDYQKAFKEENKITIAWNSYMVDKFRRR